MLLDLVSVPPGVTHVIWCFCIRYVMNTAKVDEDRRLEKKRWCALNLILPDRSYVVLTISC